MTIREMEARCGMDRANIRFYEREGLLTAPRLQNGYRDYTEENAQTLLRIRLLRSLHVPLDEIRALQTGEKALPETLRDQLARLAREEADAAAGASAGRSRRSTSHFPSWTRRNISAVWKAARPRALRRSWRRTARRIPAARCGAILQGGSTAASIRCCPSGFCRFAACCSRRRRGFRCCWS